MLLNNTNDMYAAFISGTNTCVSKPLSLNTAIIVDSKYWSLSFFDMVLVEVASIFFSGNRTPLDII